MAFLNTLSNKLFFKFFLLHTVSEVQDSGNGLAEWFWLRVRPEIVFKLVARVVVLSRPIWS